MDAITTATLAWVLAVTSMVGLLALMVRSLRQIRSRVRAERVRSAFAEARKDLVSLAIKREIPTESATYQTLYFLDTAVMRRDDQYEQIWPDFLGSLKQVNDPKHVNPMRDESKTWSPAVAAVALKTCAAMEVMLVEHSLLLRALFRLTGGMMPYLQAVHCAERKPDRMQAVKDRIEVIEMRHQPARRDVRRFQKVLLGPSANSRERSLQPC